MAKVRVPKELRPPSRFEPFEDPEASGQPLYSGKFRCTGKYRNVKRGEYYWICHPGEPKQVMYAYTSLNIPYVILERLP